MSITSLASITCIARFVLKQQSVNVHNKSNSIISTPESTNTLSPDLESPFWPSGWPNLHTRQSPRPRIPNGWWRHLATFTCGFTFMAFYIFRFSRIAPWPLTRFPKFLHCLVGTRGAQGFWGINCDICSPIRGPGPTNPNFTKCRP